ncbi:MAG TPA: helix-turn-helix transcriptional regulator [Solirubrobacteraceae bacterium]|jgi:transcriptional regulator with XRE-family HTH domain|nr:helix-turn-helix transcriptional regulator [Solirubrobacteraceae bacterium]
MASDTEPAINGPRELGAFLRARRAELAPHAVGLEEAGNRRVRGLRREEVAQLAAISTDYYTRLEQGRLASASQDVLDALATALRLNPDERSYLYKLANKDAQHQRPSRDAEGVRAQTRQLLESLRDCPGLVLDRYLDVLAWNRLASAVFKDFAIVPRRHRNFMRMLFLDPELRGRFVEWEPVARAAVGFLRAAVAPHEPRLANLIGELSLADPDFRTWWAERHVNYTTFGTRTYTHPLTGPYPLDRQILRLPDDDQLLMVLTAPPGTVSMAVLRQLETVASG